MLLARLIEYSIVEIRPSKVGALLCDLCQKLNTKKVCFFLDLVYWFKLLETQKKLRPGSFHSLSLAKGL